MSWKLWGEDKTNSEVEALQMKYSLPNQRKAGSEMWSKRLKMSIQMWESFATTDFEIIKLDSIYYKKIKVSSEPNRVSFFRGKKWGCRLSQRWSNDVRKIWDWISNSIKLWKRENRPGSHLKGPKQISWMCSQWLERWSLYSYRMVQDFVWEL